MTRLLACILGILVAMPSALADEGSQNAATTTNADEDPLTARLRAEVRRYYSETKTELTEANEQSGLEAARFMLLDGVSVEQMEAAVDEAVLRHRPDQSVSFEVAVPMRVGAPASSEPAPASAAPEPAAENVPASEPPVETRTDPTQRQLEIQNKVRRKHRIRGNLALGFGIGMIPIGALGVGTGIGLLAFVRAVDDGASDADGFGALFYGLFTLFVGPAAYATAMAGIFVGTAFIVAGHILVGVGIRHLELAKRVALLEHPERRYSLARRAEVDWGFRFGRY